MNMKFLAVITPLPIYLGLFTPKMFWEGNFTPVNMINCSLRNVNITGISIMVRSMPPCTYLYILVVWTKSNHILRTKRLFGKIRKGVYYLYRSQDHYIVKEN